VAEVLEAVFGHQPELRGYLLDDQGRVRQHVMIFVNGSVLTDRERLSDPVTETSEIYIMQALSGG
jgi:sulfur carrier protein ThiS